MDEFMSEFLTVLRGSNAIAVPEKPKDEKPQHDGFYSPASARWLNDMQETVRLSRARRKGVIRDEE